MGCHNLKELYTLKKLDYFHRDISKSPREHFLQLATPSYELQDPLREAPDQHPILL